MPSWCIDVRRKKKYGEKSVVQTETPLSVTLAAKGAVDSDAGQSGGAGSDEPLRA